MLIAEPEVADEFKIGQPGYRLKVFACIEGPMVDKPWSSLSRSLADAARQLPMSGTGIVAIHYVDHVANPNDLRPDDETLQKMKNDTGRKGDVEDYEKRLIVALAMQQEFHPNVGAVFISSEPNYGTFGDPGTVHTYVKEGRLPDRLTKALRIPLGSDESEIATQSET